MKTLDKLRGKFFNSKSFNVGFGNRSPLSYITGSGPAVPVSTDPGMKSFQPSDWGDAYDTSDAVRAETKAEIAKAEGTAGAIWGAGKMIAGAATGGTLKSGFTEKAGGGATTGGEAFDGIETAFGGGEENDKTKALQNFISENPTASQQAIDAYESSLG